MAHPSGPPSQPAERARSKAAMTSVAWFPKPAPAKHAGAASTLVRIAIGAAAGAVLYKLGHPNIAFVAWGISAVIGGISLASPAARDAIGRGLAWFGSVVGNAIGTLLLSLAFVFVIVPVRIMKWLSRSDDLKLRLENLPSYYEPCDPADRKVRYAKTMFATEVPIVKRGRTVALLATALVLIGTAETILRIEGFGPNAVVYVLDPYGGYFPAPNQNHVRYGGKVIVNSFGMRAPEYTLAKPPDVFRIFMIGDSTLWGGSYVDQDDLYARIVEKKLNELGAGKVEVLNLGVNGWGPLHERGYIEHYGTYDADLVIIHMPYDDIEREKYSLQSLPFFQRGNEPRLALEEVAMHGAWRFRRSRLSYSSEWQAAQRAVGLHEYERLVRYVQTGNPGDPPPATAPKTKVGGSEVMLHVLPSENVGFGGPPDPIETDSIKAFRDRLTPRGVPVYYPNGLFKGKGAPSEIYHDPAHLNPKGHAVYAEYILDSILNSSDRFKAWRGSRGKASQ